MGAASRTGREHLQGSSPPDVHHKPLGLVFLLVPRWDRKACSDRIPNQAEALDVANRVRLSLFILAYNLGNFLRRLCLPKAVRHWSLRSVQVKLIKMGGRLVRHARRLIFQLSEVSVPRRLFQGVLDRIGRLSPAPS